MSRGFQLLPDLSVILSSHFFIYHMSFAFPPQCHPLIYAAVLRNPGADATAARAAMHPHWQEVAARLERERKAMAKSAALHRDKAFVNATEAESLGIRVLHKDADSGEVNLGIFDMPSIPIDTIRPPKGACSAFSVETPSPC